MANSKGLQSAMQAGDELRASLNPGTHGERFLEGAVSGIIVSELGTSNEHGERW